jgi:hypothetical protein
MDKIIIEIKYKIMLDNEENSSIHLNVYSWRYAINKYSTIMISKLDTKSNFDY